MTQYPMTPEQRLRRAFTRNGCWFRPDLRRRRARARPSRKGYELRWVAYDLNECREFEALMKTVGIEFGRAFKKRQRYVLPVYGQSRVQDAISRLKLSKRPGASRRERCRIHRKRRPPVNFGALPWGNTASHTFDDGGKAVDNRQPTASAPPGMNTSMRGEASPARDAGPDRRRAVRRRPSYGRTRWLPQDIRIAEHYARTVVEGRYRSAAAAAPYCHSGLTGSHTLCSVTGKLRLLIRKMGRSRGNRRWTTREKAVVDRFARALVQRRYPGIKEALPDCQRERQCVEPTIERTDLALAWKLLLRAYDRGLPRRKHRWTLGEKRLLERHAANLVRGRYPDIRTAASAYKTARERAGFAVQQTDHSIRTCISAFAQAMGYVPPKAMPSTSPDERRIIAGFSRAVARGVYSSGMRALPDCLRTLGRDGPKWIQHEDRLATVINAGARRLGWQAYARWSKESNNTISQFTEALAAGRYSTMTAASRACLKSLRRAGRKNLQENNVRWRMIRCFVSTHGRLWRPRRAAGK
jgi:hypothetical protein